MTLRAVVRRAGAMLAVTGAAMSLPGVSSADSSGMFFDGAGRGPTAEVAIRSAIGDAATSASAYQLFTCVPVGEPQVFERFDDPNFGHVFRAQARVFCTP
jgi:hypothetical protein